MLASKSQTGVALITVLLVISIAVVAASAMVSRQFFEIRRTANVLDYEQALSYAFAVEEYARWILVDDAKNSQNLDHLGETWATEGFAVEVDGGQIAGQIEDLQGRINLNNLSLEQNGNPDPIDELRVQRLIRKLQDELQPQQRVDEKELTDAIVDWVDTNTDLRMPGGAEDMEYMLREPPYQYQAADRPMASMTELLMVKGMTAELYEMLVPYVTALPIENSQATPVNVNTAPPAVLAAIIADLDIADAEAVYDSQAENLQDGFIRDTLDKQFPGIKIEKHGKMGKEAEKKMSVNSNYFLLTASASFGQAQVEMYSVLKRDNTKVKVILRSQGSY